jgi:hypothetical protein
MPARSGAIRGRLVFIATRHDAHARSSPAALAAGKHVFVEKPLALNEERARAVERARRPRRAPARRVQPPLRADDGRAPRRARKGAGRSR